MRAFFDSNVLVYALAEDDPLRRDMATQVIQRHSADGSLVLSTQVLLETWNVLTRKKGARPADALAALRLFTRHEVLAPGAEAVLRALELAGEHKVSVWDALIVQAALEGGCDTLYTEDLQAGRRFGPLEVVNPFEPKAHEPAPPAYRTRRKTRPSAGARP